MNTVYMFSLTLTCACVENDPVTYIMLQSKLHMVEDAQCEAL